jgi:VIT1/CCC1 family predicted Fe2+/Mn2+ transporter
MDALDSWAEEKQSAWLYRRVAACEQDADRQKLFLELARGAESQADIWARDLDAAALSFHPSLRARLVAWMLGLVGPRNMSLILTAMKVRGMSVYRRPRVPAGITGHLAAHAMPESVEEVGARHRGLAGGNLRAAVFGINDGLVSNTSLIMGVAGAAAAPEIIVTAGVAGLLAGALSMASGEYVSVRSQRELYEYQIALEREELEQYPDEEAEELALIYAARGMDLSEARDWSQTLMRDAEQALDVLAREELGLDPDQLGSPVGAASFSFLAFSAGALVPLLPFVFTPLGAPLPLASALSGLSLFAVGASISLFTGRAAFYGGVRMLLIGAGAGALTYAIGHLLGVG